MSTRASSSIAREDGGTQLLVHGDRARSSRRGRTSNRRAASHRSSTALQHLRAQMDMGIDQGMVRQRYEEFRISATRGVNNINNLGEQELRDQMNNFQGLYSERSEVLRQSQQQATMDKYRQLHVPRIGFLPSPKPHGTFRWMYCQVNGLATAQSQEN